MCGSTSRGCCRRCRANPRHPRPSSGHVRDHVLSPARLGNATSGRPRSGKPGARNNCHAITPGLCSVSRRIVADMPERSFAIPGIASGAEGVLLLSPAQRQGSQWRCSRCRGPARDHARDWPAALTPARLPCRRHSGHVLADVRHGRSRRHSHLRRLRQGGERAARDSPFAHVGKDGVGP